MSIIIFFYVKKYRQINSNKFQYKNNRNIQKNKNNKFEWINSVFLLKKFNKQKIEHVPLINFYYFLNFYYKKALI